MMVGGCRYQSSFYQGAAGLPDRASDQTAQVSERTASECRIPQLQSC